MGGGPSLDRIVMFDPVIPADRTLIPSPPPRPKNPVFDDEEKSKLLAKLLKSKNPDDLQEANKLIKSMVKEELYERCETKRRTLFKLASETEDNDSSLGSNSTSHLNTLIDLGGLDVTSTPPPPVPPTTLTPAPTVAPAEIPILPPPPQTFAQLRSGSSGQVEAAATQQSSTTNSLSLLDEELLCLGLNDPAPTAAKEASENNQWSMFESMKVKLQPPSGTELSPFNPIQPPAAITQVMLLANPAKFRARGSLFIVSSPTDRQQEKHEQDLYVSPSNSRIRLSFKGQRSELYREFV
ncbi:hypothetical protein llap_15493 [Limosa lapponica baueri]|uniref:N-terminal extension of GAT domain-containing protein n=1 Tax=Limosa lapponica baueri TaxID=1758121 RepID=A0A2I0TK62_LIMLA|nr:hypothetical protein llap_15493 [Limosa lapponica baueri]